MQKKIYGLFETVILILLGVAILCFALSANYGLLMNVKFRWLTASGAVLALAMGLASLGSLQKRSGINVIIFALMILFAFLGKPYLPDADSKIASAPFMEAGLWDQIDQTRFPKKDLQALYTSEAKEVYRSDGSFTTIGVAKRLADLDMHRSFALMTTVMYCCLADAFAVGLRVPYEDWEKIKDGQRVMVSGRLGQEETEIALPNFRFGRAMLASVNKKYYLQPEKVMSYNRLDQLPLIPNRFSVQVSGLFCTALKESGLWQTLEGKGPFTIFVPVNQAIEDLDGLNFEELTSEEYRQFVSAHIVRGKYLSRDLMKLERLENLYGQDLQIELRNGKLKIDLSRFLQKDIEARNGVIHYIYPAIRRESE